jgi:hypothetical protein
MSQLFSRDWMQKFMHEWNNEPAISKELAQIKFNSNIAYGFKSDGDPVGVLVVAKGKVISAGEYDGEDLNWDLRAESEDWQEWLTYPPGMIAIGMAYTSRKLKFNQGDYAAMLKDPRMAGPFIKSFAVMARV